MNPDPLQLQVAHQVIREIGGSVILNDRSDGNYGALSSTRLPEDPETRIRVVKMLDEVTALSTFALVIQVCGDKIIIGGKDYPDCPHVPATELAVGTPEEKWWRDALEGFYKGGGPSVETGVFLTHCIVIKVLWDRGTRPRV